MKSYIEKHKKHFHLKKFIKQALHEDIGKGDFTTLSTLPQNHTSKMQLLVKQSGIIAGVEVARHIYKEVSPKIKFKPLVKDGDYVKPGNIAYEVKGPVYELLTTERLILNIMQRMSGIATQTHNLQQLCKDTKAKVIDTRKTTPLFRFFEKWAVVIGGGANHRYALYDMMLIKDNHIDFAGGITKAIDAAHSYNKKHKLKLKIEVECRSLEDVKKVMRQDKIHRIMLDNFSPGQVKQAVQFINRKYETEASGGINEKNIRAYALTGVDFISVGALTHQVKSLDLSLKAIDE